MRYFPPVFLPLLLPLLLAAEGVPLHFVDASNGAFLAPFNMTALDFGMRTGTEIHMERMKPAAALQALTGDRADLIIIPRERVPADYAGEKILWAAEVLAVYVHASNPLESLALAQVKNIFNTPGAVWIPYNGDPAHIQRLGLKVSGVDHLLETRLLGLRPAAVDMFRASTLDELWLFLNSAAILIAPLVREVPPTAKVVKINGIFPDKDSVTAGRYPLCRCYLLLYRRHHPRLRDFLQELAEKRYPAAELRLL